jgi:hypothetical protein
MNPVAICIGDSFISIIILNKRSFFVLLIVIASVGKMENRFNHRNPFEVNENESHHLIHSR